MADGAEAFLAALATGLTTDAGLKTQLEALRGVTLSLPLPAYLISAPPDEPEPFLTFNVVSDDAWNVSEATGRELLVDVHAWTKGISATPCYGLNSRVRALCTDPAWTLTGANLIYCRPQRARLIPDEGDIYHGVVSVRALIEET